MANDLDKLENLPPDKARFVLAETKLKLMNLMSHLEFLETKLAQRSEKRPQPHTLAYPSATLLEQQRNPDPVRE
jgi:hypothetical protein